MENKLDSKIRLGNIFLFLGAIINIFAVFPIGCLILLFTLLSLNTTSPISQGMFYLYLILINLVLGLFPYLLGYLILFFNRHKHSSYKKNIKILLLLHLVLVIAFTFIVY